MIRQATEADVPAMLAMGARFRAESEYAASFTENLSQMEATLRWLMADGHVLVADSNGELIGMAGFTPMMPHPYAGYPVVSEMFWWVEPEYRSGLTGIRLFRAGEHWAKSRGAERMQMVAPNEHVEQFYRALGYTKVEVAYERSL